MVKKLLDHELIPRTREHTENARAAGFFLPATRFTASHVTAFTAAAGEWIDFSRLQVRTCSPMLAAHWLVSVTCVILPRPR